MTPTGLTSQAGIINNSIGFNSNDDGAIGEDNEVADFGTVGQFTYNFWLYKIGTGDDAFFLSSQNYSFASGFGCGTNAGVRLYCALGGAGITDLGFNPSEWIMFTFMRNTTTNTIWVYVNGVLNSSSVASIKTINADTFNFGDSRRDRHYNGYLDEIGI